MGEINPFPIWIIPFPVLKNNFEPLAFNPIENRNLRVSESVRLEIVKLASQLKMATTEKESCKEITGWLLSLSKQIKVIQT